MILAGYFTGARLGNLGRLKWENIDLVERSFAFVQDKTDVKIKVPIHPELLEYFHALKMPADRGKPIFPSLCHLPGPGHNGLSMRFKCLTAITKFQIIRQALDKVSRLPELPEK